MFRFFGQYVPIKSVILAFSEMALITCSLLAALWLRLQDATELEAYVSHENLIVKIVTVVVVCFACLYYNDLYDLYVVSRRWELLIRLLQGLGAACLILAILYYAFPELMFGRSVTGLAAVIGVVAVVGWRLLVDTSGGFFRPEQRVLIAGTGEAGIRLVRELLEHPELNFQVVGFLDEPSLNAATERLPGFGIVGDVADIGRLVKEEKVDRVVLSFAERHGQMPLRELLAVKLAGIRIEDAHTLYEKFSGRIMLDKLSPSWLILSEGFRKTNVQRLSKRVIDVTFACLGLLVTSPLLLVIMLAILIESGLPVLFRQRRVGYKGREFEMLKFRSMYQNEDAAKWASSDDGRITRVGRIIRRFRLDEVPQFINVIRGEMSIVGPRPEQPLLVQILEQKIPYYPERHSVRPGITGWAQIRFKYGASVEDAVTKLEYDLFYIKHMSPLFDLVIAFRTVQVVLFGRGAV